MIDSKLLLADLQKQVTALEQDLAEQLVALPEVAALLDAEYEAEKRARRAGNGSFAWRQEQLTQIAVAWVLGTVFLRWSEDNKLIDPVLSGPGERLAQAEDAQLEHYRRHPEHTDADWLAEQFEVLRGTDAGKLLFDPEHNPMYWVPISHDAAKALTAFWRGSDGATLRHEFTDPDWGTRFLGDLYQDLSEDAKKRYALLQTPRFVESFILDRTLTPAIEEFGLDGLRLIDPACGSGHFLLGAYERLVEAWKEESYSIEPYQLAERALASVHGVDTNPFAVAIARFRLMVAALKTAGVTTLKQAAGQRWRPLVACTDSLRTLERQESFELVDEAIGYRARWEDIQDFDDQKLLYSGSYHVVVGNPPYIVPKDPDQSEYYRKRWSACYRQYQLTVPFAQRIFDLARRSQDDGLGAGFAGQITSNAFMNKEFGKKLVEEFLPTVELAYVIDASGAIIPGHGTPTVILIGRRAAPSRRDSVRAVLRVQDEPGIPVDPANGLVWSSIVRQVEKPGSESEFVSVVDIPRGRLTGHPWSLSGGGADQLMNRLRQCRLNLGEGIQRPIGRAVRMGSEEAFVRPRRRTQLVPPRSIWRGLVDGGEVRDYQVKHLPPVLYPYADSGASTFLERELWPFRRTLEERRTFSGNMADGGRAWWEYMQHTASAYTTPLSICFANVSTHNHFVLRRGGEVFDAHAPAIKLHSSASEADHHALLGLLNSSVVCFWLRQTSPPKGGSGIGRGIQPEPWMERFEFSGSSVEKVPLPSGAVPSGVELDSLASKLAALTPSQIVADALPTRDRLNNARREFETLRSKMIYLQEELDWRVYRSYGLISAEDSVGVSWDGEPVPLLLGERAFEILLARRIAAGESDSKWFVRHRSAPVVGMSDDWPEEYRRVVEARLDLMKKRRELALVERPECKRRWVSEPWEKQQERALRGWLLDRLEGRELWFEVDINGEEQPAPRSVSALADLLRTDEDFTSVASLWAGDALGRPDAELVEVIGELVDFEHVPFLAAYRHKPAGLSKRAEWERTWDLQRQEDAVANRLGFDEPTHAGVRDKVLAEVGPVPVPPKYGSGDFLRNSYWTQRGKLDVPKERFISYPAATRDGDGSLLLGWAGWDHRQQAQALAVLVGQRRGEDGWGAERVAPLLAGLVEVLPWVHQWHSEVDPLYGAAPGDIYDGFLDAQLGELELSRAQLAAWRPTGRVDVAPLPRRTASRARKADGAEPRTRRPRTAPDSAHLDVIVTAAAQGPLSNEQIRDLTGLDAPGARAAAQHLVAEGRLVTTGQRRGMRYQLP
ncbi:BREX-2 system adenine-specific DNA-methyltransferase PglX [Pseudonocardia xishanensis]|uniref:site-specific DNA-methyltransferase (adenine-specific) n=1 Tax=Pseudonocardia xishanensis TaxID=630995 RepID=A0ABP8RD50_9PSEU